MKKLSFIITIFIGLASLIMLNYNFDFKSDNEEKLKLENKLRKLIKFGYQDKFDMLSINITEDNIYLATAKNYNDEYIIKYVNESIVGKS